MTEQDLPAAATKKYTHDAWNRLTSVSIDAAVLGEYEYNALHWRSVKRSRSLIASFALVRMTSTAWRFWSSASLAMMICRSIVSPVESLQVVA